MTATTARRYAAAALTGLVAVFATAVGNPAAAQMHGQSFLGEATYTNALIVNGVREPLPACRTPDGQRVRFVMFENDHPEAPFAYRQRRGDRIGARENAAEGLPHQPGAYVILSREMFTQLSRESRALVAAHECAHHTLGHTARPPRSLQDVARHEAEADCEAVKILHRDMGMDVPAIRRAFAIFDKPFMHEGDHTVHGTPQARLRRSVACLPS